MNEVFVLLIGGRHLSDICSQEQIPKDTCSNEIGLGAQIIDIVLLRFNCQHC